MLCHIKYYIVSGNFFIKFEKMISSISIVFFYENIPLTDYLWRGFPL